MLSHLMMIKYPPLPSVGKTHVVACPADFFLTGVFQIIPKQSIANKIAPFAQVDKFYWAYSKVSNRNVFIYWRYILNQINTYSYTFIGF